MGLDLDLEELQGRIEKYSLERQLGSGANGSVFLVSDNKIQKKYAMKVILFNENTKEEIQREMVQLNVRNSWRVPYIVDAIEFGLEDKEYYGIVMEYVEGKTLQEEIDERFSMEHGEFEEKEILFYAKEMCEIMDVFHKSIPRFLYGDLKPENIIVTKNGLRLIDFGSVFQEKELQKSSIRYGTYGFSAPEIMKGDSVDSGCDIYSIGAILNYMMTGNNPANPPFHPEPIPLRKMGYSRFLIRIVNDCTLASPRERISSTDVLRERLRKGNKKTEKIITLLQTAVYYLLLFSTMAYAGFLLRTISLSLYHRQEKIILLSSLFVVTILYRKYMTEYHRNRNFIIKRDWNILYTAKKNVGLCALVFCFFFITGCVQKEPEYLPITMQNSNGQNILVKEGTTYETRSDLNFLLPVKENTMYEVYFYEYASGESQPKERYFKICR
ncbi:MAG: serine/threonine-protein kinase [Lachnospiraceae bacterium]